MRPLVGSCAKHAYSALSWEGPVKPLPIHCRSAGSARCLRVAIHRGHTLKKRSLLVCEDSASDAAAPSPPRPKFKLSSLVGPLTWSGMLGYIGFMLILPLGALLSKAVQVPWKTFIARATEPIAVAAYGVTFKLAVQAAIINAVFGFILAWVLTKYRFPLKKWVDAAVDLPFAVPTSVAGLTLATVYSEEGFLGQLLAKYGVFVVFTKLGVLLAMIFVSFPFVIRTMQPVMQEIDQEQVEAAYTLGADGWTTFREVTLPPLLPALLTGTALAFSRAVGEFGSVVIVASNFPFNDLVAPVLIFQSLEQYDYVGATVYGTVLLFFSLIIMLCVNQLQALKAKYGR